MVCTHHWVDAQIRSLSRYHSHGLLSLSVARCFIKGLDLVSSNGPSCLKISVKLTGSRTSRCLYHSNCAKLMHHIHYALFWHMKSITDLLRFAVPLMHYVLLVLTVDTSPNIMFSPIWDQYQQSILLLSLQILTTTESGCVHLCLQVSIDVLFFQPPNSYICATVYWYLQQVSALDPKGGNLLHTEQSRLLQVWSHFSVAHWKENGAFIMLNIWLVTLYCLSLTIGAQLD
jgi:hypothetical protein